MRLSLCFIGCGKWAQDVLDGTPELADNFSLFFASSDADKAREFCNTYHGEDFFDNYNTAVQDQRVKAVYFATPHHVHLDNVKLAAREQKHVMVEKPIARTAMEAESMIEMAREASIKFMVAENYRFLNTVNKCKDLIEQDAIGDLRLIETHMVYPAQDLGGWRRSNILRGGGIVIDAGIHYIDLMVNIGGLPKNIYAAIPPSSLSVMEGEDGAVITARFDNGVVGLVNIYAGSLITEKQEIIHITGTRGQIRFYPYGNEVILDTSDRVTTFEVPDSGRGHRAMFSEFKDAILQDKEPQMSGEEGLRDLLVVLAAYRSAETGNEVAIDIISRAGRG